jgi:SNF2 family DNA or RNA helicase
MSEDPGTESESSAPVVDNSHVAEQNTNVSRSVNGTEHPANMADASKEVTQVKVSENATETAADSSNVPEEILSPGDSADTTTSKISANTLQEDSTAANTINTSKTQPDPTGTTHESSNSTIANSSNTDTVLQEKSNIAPSKTATNEPTTREDAEKLDTTINEEETTTKSAESPIETTNTAIETNGSIQDSIPMDDDEHAAILNLIKTPTVVEGNPTSAGPENRTLFNQESDEMEIDRKADKNHKLNGVKTSNHCNPFMSVGSEADPDEFDGRRQRSEEPVLSSSSRENREILNPRHPNGELNHDFMHDKEEEPQQTGHRGIDARDWAAQRAMKEQAQRLMVQETARIADSQFSNHYMDHEDGSRPRKKQNNTHSGKDIPLHEQPFEEVDANGRNAAAEFRIASLEFLAKKARGDVTTLEEFQYGRLVTKERGRRSRVLLEKRALSPEEPLFVPQEPESPILDDSDHGFSLNTARKRKRGSDRKQPTPESNRGGSIFNRPPFASPQNGNASSSKSKRKKAKSGKPKGPQMTNISSMMGYDPFTSAVPLQDGEEEGFQMKSRRRKEALKELLASLPEDQQPLHKLDKKALEQATQKFIGKGRAIRSGPNGGWKLKGMASEFKHFQMLGAGWMVDRETSETEPRGGLCCDDMGLGKTVMMLGVIINNCPPKSVFPRSTLIVVPSSLLHQWKAEIEKHLEEKVLKEGRLMVFKTIPKDFHMTDLEGELQRCLIVLTTHAAVMRSCKKIEFPPQLISREEKEEWLTEHRDEFRDIFHKLKFHRVVVDEAHCMKNHLSRTSIALRELDAKFRWVLTATPLHNSPLELYPYLKFLRLPGVGNYRTFNHNYGPSTAEGSARLSTLLNLICLRRTYSDQLFGEAIIKLPKTGQVEQSVTFNDIEREVYQICKHRTIQILNDAARSQSLNIHCILAQINRLRQVTSHMFLVKEAFAGLLTREDIEKLNKLMNKTSHPDTFKADENEIRQLRLTLNRLEEQTFATRGDPSLEQQGSTPQPCGFDMNDVGHGHGIAYNFGKYLEALLEQGKQREIEKALCCSMCNAPPHQIMVPMITSCGHLYCEECVTSLQFSAAMHSDDAMATCSKCNSTFYNVEPYRVSPAPPDDVEDEDTETNKKKKKKSSIPSWAWIKKLDPDIVPSAKTKAVKAQLLNWIQNDNKCKVLIFTQWVGMIFILEKVCQAEGWKCFPFYGGMTLDQRQTTIESFQKYPGACILLSSLRCGGIGLNLTMASKVRQ